MTLQYSQVETHQKRFEQERKVLKLRVSELENKIEVLTQDLDSAESTIERKNSDMLLLQNNLKELEELREMKEVFVLFLVIFIFIVFSFVFVRMVIMHFLILLKCILEVVFTLQFYVFRILTEKMSKQPPF